MLSLAKLSMMNAVAEVKALPNYATGGEVCTKQCTHLYNSTIVNVLLHLCLYSGMLGMIQRPMPFTQLSLACLEGKQLAYMYM